MTCPTCLDRVDIAFASGCGCDHSAWPPCDTTPPGLAVLPPQGVGFPGLRERLLSMAGREPGLTGWGARAEDDLGVMLLESWAYLLDIVYFYNRRAQGRGFIRTAPDPATLARLVALIGYRPRPAIAASVTIAVEAADKGAVTIPAGTQFRSQGSPGIAPQLFEARTAAIADPRTNGWTLAPLRSPVFGGLIAFAPRAPGVLPGQIVAMTLAGAPVGAARVDSIAARAMPDGAQYRTATLSSVPPALTGQPLASIGLHIMADSAGPSMFAPLTGTAPTAATRTEWLLDGVYTQFRAGDLVVLEAGGAFNAATISTATLGDIQLGTSTAPVAGKATRLTFATAVALGRIHFRAVRAGALINPADPVIDVDALDVTTLALAGPAAAIGDAAAPTRLAAVDKGDAGLLIAGSVTVAADGEASATTGAIVERQVETLSAPVRLLGNLIEATRGQTIANEVLGSADAGQAWQRFRLARKPLTYFPDPVRPGGVAPELEVRVNGILWTRIESFLAAPRGGAVYVVRHTPEGDTDIVFGDAVRPPTGVGNVTATYRFGAGAASPPPGKLTQVVGRLANLRRVIAPFAARGGADGESADAIRTAAPRSTLGTGRAVSIADYASLVAGYPGVIASAVDWVWVPDAQRAGVLAWIVPEGGDVSVDLAAVLAAAGDPLTTVDVRLAIASPHMLAVDVVVDPAFVAADVRAAVAKALGDPIDGLLAPRRGVIGGALFRSRIAHAAAVVPGVVAVRSILLDGADMPAAVSAIAGRYMTFSVAVGGS